MIPSTTDLYYFQIAATELHFGRAAQKLGVTPPSLTIAIKRLENTLNLHLFIRHKKGVTLTRAGSELFHATKKMLAEWENTLANVKSTTQSVSGVIRIGCHSTQIPFMSEMISCLCNQYSGLEIHFQDGVTPQLQDSLVQGHCDIALLTNPDPHPDIILHYIAESEFGCWVSKEHQEKFDIYSENTVFICHPELPQTQQMMKLLLKLTKLKQLKKTIIHQLESIVSMTIEGYGIGIMQSNYTRKFFSDKLTLVTGAPIYKIPMYFAYRPENKEVKAIRVVLDAMKEAAQEYRLKEVCTSA